MNFRHTHRTCKMFACIFYIEFLNSSKMFFQSGCKPPIFTLILSSCPPLYYHRSIRHLHFITVCQPCVAWMMAAFDIALPLGGSFRSCASWRDHEAERNGIFRIIDGNSGSMAQRGLGVGRVMMAAWLCCLASWLCRR